MKDLKPCPFCGGEAAIAEIPDTHNNNVWLMPVCIHCDCKLDNGWRTQKEVIDIWNRRAE